MLAADAIRWKILHGQLLSGRHSYQAESHGSISPGALPAARAAAESGALPLGRVARPAPSSVATSAQEPVLSDFGEKAFSRIVHRKVEAPRRRTILLGRNLQIRSAPLKAAVSGESVMT